MRRGEIRHTNLALHLWPMNAMEICFSVPCGGKPRRRKLEVTGRPSGENKIMAKVTSPDLPQFAATPIATNFMLQDLICQICSCIPNQPLEVLTCRHYIMCVPCVVRSCNSGGTLLRRYTNMSLSTVRTSSSYDKAPIGKVCGQVMELQHLKGHLASECAQINIPPPSKITLDYLLDTSITDNRHVDGKSDSPLTIQWKGIE